MKIDMMTISFLFVIIFNTPLSVWAQEDRPGGETKEGLMARISKFQPAEKRRALRREFPWAVLVVLNAGPELTAGLVTLRWAVTVCVPGLFRRRRLTGLWGSEGRLGIAYAGWVAHEFNKGEDEGCKNPGDEEEDATQCRYIVELVPQDSKPDPTQSLLLLRMQTPFLWKTYVNRVVVPNEPVLPPFHREQCVAVWYAPVAKPLNELDVWEDVLIGDAPIQRPRRAQDSAILGGMRPVPPTGFRWDLWRQPKGLWHAVHCDPRATKPGVLCEDSWKAEEIELRKLPDYTGRPPADKHGAHAGSPGQCTPRARQSAVAVCQGVLCALRLLGEDAEDMLLVGGTYPNQQATCTDRSVISRRLWIWVGSAAAWIEKTVSNCSEKPVFQEMALRTDTSSAPGGPSTTITLVLTIVLAVAIVLIFVLVLLGRRLSC